MVDPPAVDHAVSSRDSSPTLQSTPGDGVEARAPAETTDSRHHRLGAGLAVFVSRRAGSAYRTLRPRSQTARGESSAVASLRGSRSSTRSDASAPSATVPNGRLQ